MNFSPSVIPSLIINPLRYFFSTYGGPAGFKWDEDPKKSQIDISHVNDFFKVPLEQKPRILVDRGSYVVSKVGLSDNLAEQSPHFLTRGLRKRINMHLIQGTSQVLIETRNLGTCEILTDMAQKFMTWARPTICDSQGFKDFGLPMQVSEARVVDREDTEKFQVGISLPWFKEEQWQETDDGVILKDLLPNFTLTNKTVVG